MYKTKSPQPKKPEEQQQDRTTEAFLREVDEAIHEEKLLNFWRKWRGVMIGFIVLLFLTVGGTEAYLRWTENQQQEAAAKLYQATDEPQLMNELLQSNVAGIRLLAHVQQAEQHVAAGEIDKAVNLYETAALDAPERLQYLLKYYAALATAQDDPSAADSRLAQLDVSANPFRASALTLQAELLEQQGDRATALTVWEKLLTLENVSASQRERARNRRLAIEAIR